LARCMRSSTWPFEKRASAMLRTILACAVFLASTDALMLPGAAPRSVQMRTAGVNMQVTIDAKTVKKLRDTSGAGMMDCKKALVNADGDMEVALEALRAKGMLTADKKAGRAAKEGIIETYVHTGSKLGVMIEVNCETDFVAKREEMAELAKALAMQVAACPSVEAVSEKDISAEWIEKEKAAEAMSEDLAGKPENIVEKIVQGRIDKAIKTKLLMEQPYIRDSTMSVNDLVKSYVAKLGENIQVARFTRFNVGETQDDEEEEGEDFAAEVARMTGK